MSKLEEQATLLALISKTDGDWHGVASIVEEVGSACALLEGQWTGFETFSTDGAEELARCVNPEDIAHAQALIEKYSVQGVILTTVLDSDYPSNLRHVFNRPPFLFVKGSLLPEDDRAVAVVGTRKASKPALGRAKQLASQLVEHGITVLSGLAAGIDSAAHEAALDARGRTVAVMGTGIETIYPAKNSKLADRILAEGGALVSQFWPDAPPTRFSFPMRNVVMSGMATGTAVIEANSISGAKMQARLALQHGKRLFLMKDLVMQEEWAQRYAKDPGATVVSSVEDIIEVVGRVIKPPTQLTLT
jgi:DNA processing protein